MKPPPLKKGDVIHLHEPRNGVWRAVVTVDQIQGDPCIWFALETDDPEALDYGRRTAWRTEVSLVRPVQALTTPLGELVGRS